MRDWRQMFERVVGNGIQSMYMAAVVLAIADLVEPVPDDAKEDRRAEMEKDRRESDQFLFGDFAWADHRREILELAGLDEDVVYGVVRTALAEEPDVPTPPLAAEKLGDVPKKETD